MFKKTIILLLFVLNFTFFSFAKINNNDCKKIETLEKMKHNIFNNNFFFILEEKNYDRAIINLKKYCDWNNETLESSIFINHLLDIQFRQIDWIKWVEYGIELDKQWKARRDFLNNIQKKYNTNPSNIYKNFIKYRGEPDKNISINLDTLYWKYLASCKDLYTIYNYVTFEDTYNWIELSQELFSKKCKWIIKLKYQKEVQLVEKLIFQNYYNIVNKTLFKWFNQIYWKEIWNLYDKFIISLWNFEYMVIRFIKVTDANE